MDMSSPKMSAQARQREAVDTVRRRRAELRETLDALERALAAPAADRAVVWGERLHAAVDRLATEFALHVEVTEGPDGLHQTILDGDLRLANQVAALADEHTTIAAEIAALAAVVRGAGHAVGRRRGARAGNGRCWGGSCGTGSVAPT